MRLVIFLLLAFLFIETGCSKTTVIQNQNTAAKRRENKKKRKGHHKTNNYFGKSHKDKYK